MTQSRLTRRQFNRWLAACALAAGTKVYAQTETKKTEPAVKLIVAGIDPHVSPDAGDITDGYYRCPLEMTEEGVFSPGLSHEGNTRSRAD